MHRKAVIVRPPSPLLAEGLVTHIGRSSVDYELAVEQWLNYVAVFKTAGWNVIEAQPVPACPDSVFIEDQVVVYGDQALLCRSGAAIRRAEQVGLEQILTDQGYSCHVMQSPNTLDGGDVLKHDGRMWVGVTAGGRTNGGGVADLTRMVAQYQVDVVTVPVTKALHLKSALTMLPTGETLGWEPVVDTPAAWPGFISMPEEAGAHVVLLDERKLIMADSAPQSAQLLRDRGYEVLCVDISEFEKIEGCVTCLSIRLRG